MLSGLLFYALRVTVGVMADDAGRDQSNMIQEVLPKAGLVYSEKTTLMEVLCKPKIMPIKSVALERLEQMEADAKKVLSAAPQAANSDRAMSRSGRPTSARPASATSGRLRSAQGQR